MEECEFCKKDDFLEATKLLGARMVQLEFGRKASRLETWLFCDDMDDQPVLHIGISDYGNEETITELNIPISFCPRCGRKLKK